MQGRSLPVRLHARSRITRTAHAPGCGWPSPVPGRRRRYPVSYTHLDECVNHVVDWHWQLELEFAIVQKGSIELTVQKDVVTIHENEGYIIFPNKLHQVKKNGNQCGIYLSLIHI